MKKALLFFSLVMGGIFSASAQVPCTPDSTHFVSGKYVYPDSLPCIQRGQAFSGVISIQIPDSVDAHTLVSQAPAGSYVHIDSMRIDSITGLPTGISAATNPAAGVWLHGGRYGCALFSGTTMDSVGAYRLNIYGRGCVHGTVYYLGFPIPIDSCVSDNLGSAIKFSLQVCGGVGITEIASGVDLNIYPNPNQGAFTVTVSSADHISGQLSVLDQLGRAVHTQEMEATGTKQIPVELGNIAPGVYIMMMNTANGKTVKEFSVK